jgi:Cu2+-containing amine oxidase
MQRLFFVALLVLLMSFLGTLGGGPPDTRDLTAAEQSAMLNLVEKTLRSQKLWQGKIYLTNIEVVPDNRAKPPERYALVSYYRYEGDLVIRATVHLARMTVTDVQLHEHMPASLAPEELVEAEKIARTNPDVKKALAKYKHVDKIEVDAMVAQIALPEVPGYHHRVIRLFFRDDKRNYLQSVPMVDVDLTTGEVRLDLIANMHKKN